MLEKTTVEERIEVLAERSRQDFRNNAFEYQRLHKEYKELHFYNIIKKVKLSKQMKKARENMNIAERRYDLFTTFG